MSTHDDAEVAAQHAWITREIDPILEEFHILTQQDALTDLLIELGRVLYTNLPRTFQDKANGLQTVEAARSLVHRIHGLAQHLKGAMAEYSGEALRVIDRKIGEVQKTSIPGAEYLVGIKKNVESAAEAVRGRSEEVLRMLSSNSVLRRIGDYNAPVSRREGRPVTTGRELARSLVQYRTRKPVFSRDTKKVKCLPRYVPVQGTPNVYRCLEVVGDEYKGQDGELSGNDEWIREFKSLDECESATFIPEDHSAERVPCYNIQKDGWTGRTGRGR